MKFNMDRNLKILSAALSLAIAASCSKVENNISQTGGGESHKIKAVFSGYAGESPGSGDAGADITGISAYHFANGKFVRSYEDFTSSGGGYSISMESLSGTLYMVAVTEGSPQITAPGTDAGEDAWKKTVISFPDGKGGVFYSGTAALDGIRPSNPEIPVSLTRGVARIDLKINVAGTALVKSVTFKNVATKSYLFPGEETVPVDESSVKDVTISPDKPVGKDSSGIAYILEQATPDLTVVIEAEIDGRQHSVKADMPDLIERNTVYSVTLKKDSIDAGLVIEVEEWEQGGNTDLVPDRETEISVDPDRSSLNGSISLSDDGRTLTLPHLSQRFTIVLDCPEELEALAPESKYVSIEPSGFNTFTVAKALLPPGEEGGATELRFKRKSLDNSYPDDRILLDLKENPSSLEGKLSFSGPDYTYDFEKYVENELGIFTIPEGKKISVEFEKGEDPWMKTELQNGKTSSYRILGGWKPNDATADGRSQSGKIVICNSDGSDREEYTVVRRNWGLPVVQIGDTWWCRYNLRGTSTDFADQITSAQDTVTYASFTRTLLNAPEDILLGYLGDQYQAGNTEGLKLAHDGTYYYFDGFSSSTGNFGTLSPTSMTPDGYMIPDKEDFGFLAPNENYNMGGVGSHDYQNKSGTKINVMISEKQNVTLVGKDYGVLEFYDFTVGGEHLHLFGLGHQFAAGSNKVSPINILFATYGDSSKSWGIEGYASTSNKPRQNWLKYSAHNAFKTRTIRCIKSPVEYIYQ